MIPREKARAVAESLARRLQPEKFARMTANPSPSAYPGYRWPALDAVYHFSWSPTHDGIPVGGDGLHIAVGACSCWRRAASCPHRKSLPRRRR
ncbi:MAG: hypothetical protein H5T99_00860 [Moorella sp. (in: Bacteria)]|nr:hypothetical protein [Moorella sp. (in: firmicutes)]